MSAIAIPTLDARNTIPARLAQLDVSQSFFAEYCDLSKVDFSRILNGQKPMSGDQTEKFYAALADLEWAFDWYYPWKPPLSDARRLRNFIAAVRELKEEVSRRRLREMWEYAA
jgi:hypothetical protein